MMIRALALLTALCGLALAAAPALAADVVFFTSPSGNIACVISPERARCDIEKHDWKSPKRPASCEQDFGSVLTVGPTSTRGRFGCVGDTARDPKASTLSFGKTVRIGKLRCTSRSDGVRCQNRRAHGFLVGRQAYKLF